MLPFSIQKQCYKWVQRGFKLFARHLPFPKPTIFSGSESSLHLCDAIADMDIRNILIVTDRNLLEIGLLENIKNRLEHRGVGFVVFDEVEPDPTSRQVEAGVRVLKGNGCEALLAVGGGSVIDCAKIIGACATNNKRVKKLAGLFRVFKAPLPLFVVPTTAGTGSEVTLAAVISHPVTHKKFSIIDPKLMPMMAALDGSLMTGLPPHITSATGMDALTHAVEAYISRNALPDTDRHAIAAIRLIMENLPVAVNNGADINARQNMALASYYAGIAFTRAGVGYVHAIAHNFGAYYQTPHGLANAIVLPHVLDFSLDAITDRLAKLAEVSGLEAGNESNLVLARKFIQHVREVSASFGIPSTLSQLKRSDIPAISRSALKEAHFTYAVPKYMNQATCEKLVSNMLE